MCVRERECVCVCVCERERECVCVGQCSYRRPGAWNRNAVTGFSTRGSCFSGLKSIREDKENQLIYIYICI